MIARLHLNRLSPEALGRAADTLVSLPTLSRGPDTQE